MNDFQNQNLQEEEHLKNAAGVDTSKFAKKVHLASWKSNVDKLDVDKLNVLSGLSNLKSKVDKLETTGVDLSKLSNVVKNDVVKKAEHNAKIKNIVLTLHRSVQLKLNSDVYWTIRLSQKQIRASAKQNGIRWCQQ